MKEIRAKVHWRQLIEEKDTMCIYAQLQVRQSSTEACLGVGYARDKEHDTAVA